MKTKLTALLGIRYPVLQGGMAWTSESILAAAVSNAGGAGIIATGGRSIEWVREEIRKAKAMTDKPFGVNLMLMAPNVQEIVDVVCEEKVAFVTTGAGDPLAYIPALHAAGVKVIPVVPNVRLSEKVQAAGADAMVIEGMEGGGHLGTQTTMALMTNVLSKPHTIPVIVAGGISDGRGVAAALLMGGDGVQIGSRFILSTECQSHIKAKEAIIKAVDTDSAVTGFSRGNAVRCLQNNFTRRFLELECSGASQEELNSFAAGTNYKGAVEGDTENGAVLCGQSLNVLNEILPCENIMQKLMQEARATLANARNIEL